MDTKDKLVTLEDLKAVHDEVARYTTCSTAAGTAAKTAALTNFVLTTGSAVKVKFTNTNTAANPTLNVNSTGAKPIMQYGTTAAGITPPESWDDGAVVELVYDGTNWVMQGRNTIDAVSKANGGTFNGEVVIDRQDGTASTEGWSGLTVGNNIPKGTAKNSTGYVRIFGKTGYRTDLNHKSDGMPTANHAIYLPDATGTIALEAQTGASGNSQYTKFPDGTLMQWGLAGQYVAGNRADIAITMPLAFVNSSYSVFANGEVSDDTNNYEVLIVIRRDNAQKFTAHIRNATGNYIRQFNWLAIGRWK